MKEQQLGPINGADSQLVAKMVDYHITRQFDEVRMRQFWKRLFSGENDPKVLADGICQALGFGRYVHKSQAEQNITMNLNFAKDTNAEQIAAAITAQLQRAEAYQR